LTLEPLRALRSETKGRAEACPDRTRTIPCTLPAVTPAAADSNGDSNSISQRQALAVDGTQRHMHILHGNLGYVRPEKQTVGDQRQGAVTVANTVAKPLDKTRPVRTAVECPPSTQTA
jgi:hypothetical protein